MMMMRMIMMYDDDDDNNHKKLDFCMCKLITPNKLRLDSKPNCPKRIAGYKVQSKSRDDFS